MEFSLRCRCWSLMQVVAIIMACYRGKVSSERAQSCVGARLSLRCPEMMVIEITDVVIGDSVCLGIDCCITDTDCTKNANPSHTADVHSRCDGQNSCTVDVVREEFGCGYLGFRSQNDFERITYNCRNDSRRYIAARSSSVHVQLTTVTFTSTLDISEAEELTLPPHAAPGHAYNSATYGIVIIICVVCLIVIIAVLVSVAIVTVRRKKRRQVKSSDAIKKSDVETDRKEAIYMNDAVRNSVNENAGLSVPIYINSGVRSLETRTSDYCEIEEGTSGGIQSDNQYEKLDHMRRNYEPLIVYQQLQ